MMMVMAIELNVLYSALERPWRHFADVTWLESVFEQLSVPIASLHFVYTL